MGSMPASCPTAPSCRPATTSRDAHPTTTAARCLRFIWGAPFVRPSRRCPGDGETRSEVHPLQVTRTAVRPMSDNVTSGPASLPATRPGSYNALPRASNGSATLWLNVGNRTFASGRPAGFLEGDCGLPQPQCSDASSLGKGRGPTRSPSSAQGTRVGVRVQERARRLGQRAKSRIRTSEHRTTRLPQLPDPSDLSHSPWRRPSS